MGHPNTNTNTDAGSPMLAPHQIGAERARAVREAHAPPPDRRGRPGTLPLPPASNALDGPGSGDPRIATGTLGAM
jgi:hypothetical protein